MSTPTPNKEQQRLISETRGVLLVDAGAGTGKTFALTKRYVQLLEEGVDPDDILLLTFTNNAAREMRERILQEADVDPAKLQDAPISTFHSHCKRILERYGFHAPGLLGIPESLPPDTPVLEDQVLEKQRFREFLHGFIQAHPEHAEVFRVLRDPGELLGLLKSLAAKGIYPTAEGWYRNGEELLDGDFEAFQDRVEALNTPRSDGGKQSILRERLDKYKDKLVTPGAPDPTDLRGGYGAKQADADLVLDAFHEDRDALKAFVHDVYHGYATFALERGYVNFSHLVMFATALLIEDHEVREELQRSHVLVDEFQDTSEVQFQLALLLAGEANLCCVGDWKQSIYSFQYASVDNILHFQQRLHHYAEALNDDTPRVPFTPETPVRDLELVENYRSTQPILDVSETSLVLPATSDDEVDAHEVRSRIVRLRSNADHPESRLEAIQSEDEAGAVLTKIQNMVGNPDYAVEDEESGELRPPTYSDIAVLTRTRNFALELEERARHSTDEEERSKPLPVSFEGGVELFDTDEAKLLLAWLRVAEDRGSDRGWAVILEHAGYNLAEVQAILDHEDEDHPVPEAFESFRNHLHQASTAGALATRVFHRYGLDNGTTAKLVEALESTRRNTDATRSDLIQYMEDSLDAGTTVETHNHPGGDVTTIQTIHGAKGLEYPIVLLADVNQDRFPSTGGGYGTEITYNDPTGLRQTKLAADPIGHMALYDNWRWQLLSKALPKEYDEERRLLYVALTRAKQHLVVSATKEKPSPFFDGLDLETEDVDVELRDPEVGVEDELEAVDVQIAAGSLSPGRLSVHDIIGKAQTTGGKGREYGKELHHFAARYANGDNVTPRNEDQEFVAEYIDALEGDVRAEVPVYVPRVVDGEDVIVEGVIDLLHEHDGRVEVIDWKTAAAPEGWEVYREQVGVYCEGVGQVYPEREVVGKVVWVGSGVEKEV